MLGGVLSIPPATPPEIAVRARIKPKKQVKAAIANKSVHDRKTPAPHKVTKGPEQAKSRASRGLDQGIDGVPTS